MRWLEFKNQSDDDIPAFTVIRLDGLVTANGRQVFSGKKPDTYGAQWSHAINGPVAIAANRLGVCTLDFPAWVAYSTGTPAPGELWGPVNDEWELAQYVGGFRVVGIDEDHSRILVVQEPLLVIEGFLSGTLAVSSSSGQTESAGTLDVWHGDNTNWQNSGHSVTVINRDDSFAGTSGAYHRAEWVNNEWRPDWEECGE